MKNACKRLFSLMLAVVLLVSVVPFQASAAEDNVNVMTYDVKIGDEVVSEGNKYETYDDSVSAYTLLNYVWSAQTVAYAEEPVKVFMYKAGEARGKDITDVYVNTDLEPGDRVIFKFADNDQPAEKPEEPTYTVKVGVKVNGEFVMNETEVEINNETTTAGNLLKHKVPAEYKTGSLNHVWSKALGDFKDLDTEINAGDRVIFVYETEEPTKPTEGDKNEAEPIKVVVKVGKSENVVFQGFKIPANGEYAKVKDLLNYAWSSDWDNVYEFDHAWSHDQQKNVAKDGKIYAGDTVSIMLNQLDGDNETEDDKDTKDIKLTVYVGDKRIVNGKTITVNAKDTFKDDGDKWLRKVMDYNSYDYDVEDYERDGNHYTVWLEEREYDDGDHIKYPYDVFLNIYTNGNIKEPAKHVKISKGAAVDGIVSLGEVKSIVKEYFTAKDSDGIEYDGLYMAEGNWLGKFIDDNKRDSFNVKDLRDEHDVSINIMVDNVKAKTSSNNSTNPKTGDEIFMTVTIMAVSATALAGAYFFNKKRMAK